MGFLQKILERPANERPFVLIPVGYPAPGAEVPSIGKKPLAEDVNLDNLASKMDGYTGADIAAVASAAVMLALREHISKYRDPKEAEKKVSEMKVHMRHFGEAMVKIRPLSAQELNMYKKIAEQFGRPVFSSTPEGPASGAIA